MKRFSWTRHEIQLSNENNCEKDDHTQTHIRVGKQNEIDVHTDSQFSSFQCIIIHAVTYKQQINYLFIFDS